MPFCPKCGAETSVEARFCPKCGSPIQTMGVVYRRDSGGSSVGRIFSLLFGGFILLVAIGLIIGGGAILWSQTTIADKDGYMTTPSVRLIVASYAIVQDNIDISMNTGWMMNPPSKDIVSLKISATSNKGTPIFIGIATRQSAQTYLSQVNLDKIVSYTWTQSRMMDDEPIYQTIPGGAPSSPPTSQTFWITKSSGTGTQTVTWTPTTGEYWFVVMNADGSKAVDIDVRVGARVTILNWVGWGLLFGGLVLAFAGVSAVYFGAIRRP